jgi:DNA topoisomerase-1
MDAATVTLDDALRVLSLPRLIGLDPATGEQIVASNGRYGPYLRRGSESRSLESEDQLFTVDLDQAVALFAQPKTRRGRGAAAAPLREFGTDPTSGAAIVLREGRFGPYVTDGTTNASLRKGDTVEAMTSERAVELLADRRAAGPRPRPARAARGSTKASAKKVATRKVGTKKVGTKKVGARTAAPAKSGPAPSTPAQSTPPQSTPPQSTPARSTAPQSAPARSAARAPAARAAKLAGSNKIAGGAKDSAQKASPRKAAGASKKQAPG